MGTPMKPAPLPNGVQNPVPDSLAIEAEETLDRIEDGGPTRVELARALIKLCGHINGYSMALRDVAHLSPARQALVASVEVTMMPMTADDFAEIYGTAVKANERHPDWSPGWNLYPHVLLRGKM